MNFATSGKGIRNKAYLIIVSAFAIGVITGGLLMNLLASRSLANKRAPTAIEELTTLLELSPVQRDQADKVFQESRQQSKDIMKAVQPQLDDLKTRTRSRIYTLLLPPQQDKYKEWNQKRDAQREQREKQDKR